MRSFAWLCAVVSLSGSLAISGCSGSSVSTKSGTGGSGGSTSNAITVSITSPTSSPTIQAGQTVSITAAVANDSSNQGVTWAVSGGGTLSNETTTGATYNAPASVSSNTDVTVTATSVADTSASATLKITVTPAPAISVSITNPISTITAGSSAVTLNATVQNDSSNSGVTWTLTAGGSSCSPTCGSLSSATSSSVTYTPPSTAPASPDNAPTITATSVADTSKSATDSFTISAPVVQPIVVTITDPITSVTAGSATVTLNATVQNDSSNSGVTWTLTAGGNSCSPACGSLTGAAATSVSYVPPTSVPAAPDNAPTVTATSVADTTKSASDAFTITSSTATNNDAILKGEYAFLVAGQMNAMTASITTDGNGNITGGEEDWISGSDLNAAIVSGSYTVQSDNIGTLTFTDASGNTFTFAIAMGTLSSGVATEGQMISFTATAGLMGPMTGAIALQNSTAFSTSALSGAYAFGFPGWDGNGNPSVSVGSFTVSSGTVTNGLFDENDDGSVSTSVVLTGTLGSVDAHGRFTLMPTVGGSSALPIPCYAVSAGKWYCAAFEGNTAVTYGTVVQQTGGPYAAASLNGNTIYEEQSETGVPSPHADLGILTFDGTGSTTASLDVDDGGGADQTLTATATYTVTSTTNGRVVLNPAGASPVVFYMIAPDHAFSLDESTTPGFGTLEAQSAGPFTNASLKGSFFIGTLPLVGQWAPGTGSIGGPTLTYSAGVSTATGAGSVTVTTDTYSCSAGSCGVLTTGTRATESYSVGSNGRVTFGNGGSTILYIVSPTRFYFLTIPSGTTANPTIGLGQQ